MPDFPEGCAELLDAKSVDDWVHSGVAVGEQDGDVDDDYRLLAVRAEECDAVDDVEGEPADSKEKKDQSQGFSQIQLLVVVLVGVGVAGGELLIVELLVDHVEDLGIDNQHEEEGRQHPAEEVKIHHVVHADDIFKLAGDNEVGAVQAILLEATQVVPAQHGCEAHDESHRPAHHHRQPGSPRGHHLLVPAGANNTDLVSALSLTALPGRASFVFCLAFVLVLTKSEMQRKELSFRAKTLGLPPQSFLQDISAWTSQPLKTLVSQTCPFQLCWVSYFFRSEENWIIVGKSQYHLLIYYSSTRNTSCSVWHATDFHC